MSQSNGWRAAKGRKAGVFAVALLAGAFAFSGTARSSEPPPREYRLYLMAVDGRNPTEVTREQGYLQGRSWSPDGRRLLLETSDREIWDCSLTGRSRRQLTREPEFDGRAVYSPDGKYIAFDSQRGGNFDIYVMRSDGSELRRLTTDPAFDLGPCWSPDGRRIAFHSRRLGLSTLFVMKPDGSNQKALTSGPVSEYDFSWSPNSRQLVFSRREAGEGDLHRINADGTGEFRLTRGLAATGPGWHRNGRILFTAGRWPEGGPASQGVCTIRPDGTELRALARSGSGPAWSPDGRRIAFNREGEVWTMNADGTNPVQVTTGPQPFVRTVSENPHGFPIGYRGWPSWSPDGKKIAFLADNWDNYLQ